MSIYIYIVKILTFFYFWKQNNLEYRESEKKKIYHNGKRQEMYMITCSVKGIIRILPQADIPDMQGNKS